MKIVQTLWTKPGLTGGWLNACYHLMSWTLSCLQLRKYYDEVELYTDALGKSILVDTFKLPYTRVHTVLDSLDYPGYYWAVPKIYVYGLQDKPFLHVDGDVFIWNKFFGSSIERGVVYQNMEFETTRQAFYTITLDMLRTAAAGEPLPEWIDHFKPGEAEAINAGVFGGNNIAFFKQHAQQAFEFLESYKSIIGRMAFPQTANHLAEQVLSRILLNQLNVTHTGLLPPMRLELTKEESPYEMLNHFGISPHGVQYTHLIGYLKTDQQISRMLANRLFISYPDYYERVIKHFRAGLLPDEQDENKWAHNILMPGYVSQHRSNTANNLQSIREMVCAWKPVAAFSRTLLLYERFVGKHGVDNMPLPDFIQWMQAQLSTIPGARSRERLQDIFDFEYKRYRYICSIKNDEDHHASEQELAQRVDWLYDPGQPGLHELSFCLNERCTIVYSKWDWTKKPTVDKLSGNWQVAASQVQTVIAADILFRQFIEYNMTSLCQALLYVFAETKTYKEGMTDLAEFIDDPWQAGTQQHIFEGLVYLVVNNILAVTKPTAEQRPLAPVQLVREK
ncbi:MAG TPA: DUF6734 family protein [Chitinophagaceae bacterium]|nr:DUF6734 family protein [Chitinophagaceae bacterium]